MDKAVEYAIEGWYENRYGWEVVCIEESIQDARDTLQLYRENEPQYKHRIKERKVG